MTDWLNPAEAAAYTGVNIGTMSQWRTYKVGPPFYRLNGPDRDPQTGRVNSLIRYDRAELDAWLTAARNETSRKIPIARKQGGGSNGLPRLNIQRRPRQYHRSVEAHEFAKKFPTIVTERDQLIAIHRLLTAILPFANGWMDEALTRMFDWPAIYITLRDDASIRRRAVIDAMQDRIAQRIRFLNIAIKQARHLRQFNPRTGKKLPGRVSQRQHPYRPVEPAGGTRTAPTGSPSAASGPPEAP